MKRLFKNWEKHLKHVQSVDEFKNSKLQKKKIIQHRQIIQMSYFSVEVQVAYNYMKSILIVLAIRKNETQNMLINHNNPVSMNVTKIKTIANTPTDIMEIKNSYIYCR